MHHHHHFEPFEELLEVLLGGLPEAGREFVVHFLLDTMNIFLLLIAVMMAVSFLQTYVPFEKLQKKLMGLKSFWGYLLALFMGTLSPFCSCTIIPVLIGLLRLGVPTGVCVCFLTSASLLNLGALVSLFTAVGGSFFWVYLGCALVMTLAGSMLFARLCPAQGLLVESDPHHCCGREGHHHHHHHEETPKNLRERLRGAWENTSDMLCRAWVYILVGVGLSSAAVAFIPMEAMSGYFAADHPGTLVLAVLFGAVIHSDVYSVLPVIRLVAPLSLPVSMGFTLGVMAISVPEAVLLLRVFRGRYVALYSGILTAFSLAFGLLLMVVF
ncbi:MAG: permease [Oscillospiraceae bacterium]|nr:permease [Oscillospiraceae bacterium]